MRYIALGRLQIQDADGTVRYTEPGEDVPEASNWKNVGAYISSGKLAVVEGEDENRPEPESAADAPPDAELEELGIVESGSGWYELSDGTKIRGRDEAVEAALEAQTAPEEPVDEEPVEDASEE